jgi:uncharacterized membrane protein YkvA (DUF1232 family)
MVKKDQVEKRCWKTKKKSLQGQQLFDVKIWALKLRVVKKGQVEKRCWKSKKKSLKGKQLFDVKIWAFKLRVVKKGQVEKRCWKTKKKSLQGQQLFDVKIWAFKLHAVKKGQVEKRCWKSKKKSLKGKQGTTSAAGRSVLVRARWHCPSAAAMIAQMLPATCVVFAETRRRQRCLIPGDNVLHAVKKGQVEKRCWKSKKKSLKGKQGSTTYAAGRSVLVRAR